jgi:hypothetical protein
MRYCIPVDELQKLNTEVPVEGHEIEWAEDCVTCNDVDEFSQKHIGETILDSEIVDEEQMLNKFDADNDYLKDWTREKKIEYVRRWNYGEKGHIGYY